MQYVVRNVLLLVRRSVTNLPQPGSPDRAVQRGDHSQQIWRCLSSAPDQAQRTAQPCCADSCRAAR